MRGKEEVAEFIHHLRDGRALYGAACAYCQCQNAAMQSNYSRTYFKIRYYYFPPPSFPVGFAAAANFLLHSTSRMHFSGVCNSASVFLWCLGWPPSNSYCSERFTVVGRRFLDYYFLPTMKVHLHTVQQHKRIKQPTHNRERNTKRHKKTTLKETKR